MVRRWRSWFLEGRQNVLDDERSGRPATATHNAAIAAVRNVVEADRRVTIDEIMIRLPPEIEIGRSSIGTIMSDVLNFRKKPEESAPKKAKVTISAGKVMAIVFWDCKGVLLVDYLPPNTTVNAASSNDPNVAGKLKWEIFTHPPYSPDVSPSDFHLFAALKLHLGGKHFVNDDEVQAEANYWLRRQYTAWYNSGSKKLLLQQYQKCLDRNGVIANFKQKGRSSETLDLLKLEFRNENVNKPTTFRWFTRFKNGMESVKDEKRVGRPILHRNAEKVSQISNLIKENPRIGLWDIEEETGISKSLVGSIIKEDLQLKKTPSKFVPKILTIHQKENRVEVAKKCLKWWKKTLIGRKK
ncbi:hypothetical protein LAZ67_X001152 [Cordylochernes scorpioides]|uniref:Transposase n=1 Tax=Cordylochernes scorpioides TaxID=51811 RepID=A0ABY6LUV2_9ARAC|nr:hypothetical protein LAZ67_X001152 [Cordylochernes scorpioides]